MTFPVVSFALLRQNGKFVDEDFAKWCCCHNMKWADSNIFVSEDVTSLSNCCRLKSNIKELGYFNSIGGSALEVGSIKVNTINLARLAYETTSEEEYLEALKGRVITCAKTLDVIRDIMKRNTEKGLLPNYALRNSKDVDIKFNIDDYYEAINWMQETVKEIRDCGEFESRPDDFYCQYLCDMRLKCCGETATK